ncbi:MAG: hypothetical protein FJ191_01680 [Gammaproteobacteria bacterium]|nr:hypothetical protein [Gammaproteobacteria bacterium]
MRQTYYVFEARRYFFVLSFSKSKRASGNFNLVSARAVEHVRRSFAGRQDLTAKHLATRSRKPRLVGSALHALNILYVLVAIGAAVRDERFRDRELHFNLR